MKWYRNMTDQQAFIRMVVIPLVLAVILAAFFCVSTGFTTNVNYRVNVGSADLDSIQWILFSDAANADSGWWGQSGGTALPIDTIFTLDDAQPHKFIRRFYFAGETDYITEEEIPTLAAPGVATITDANIDSIVARIGGTGSWACTLWCTAESDTITGVSVRVQDTSGSPTTGVVTTNTSGYFPFALDSGQHQFLATKGGYTWAVINDTLTSDGEHITLSGSSWTVAPPSGDSLCRLYGYSEYITGVASSRPTVIVTPVGRFNDTCNNTIIDPRPMRVGPDATGYWFIDLKKSKCLAATDGSASDSARYSVKVGDRDPVSVYIGDTDTQRLEW